MSMGMKLQYLSMNNNEINDLYNYGYKIVQNKDYFKFSLDSILLADFVKVNYTDKKMLDLCTGNAPIPIILSSKIKEIYGIEIQKDVYEMATESIKINNIKNVKIINDNVKNWSNYFPENDFDIITCNPPYFKYSSSSIINENMIKSIARHEIEINLEEIVRITSKLLKDKGRFILVHHSERLIEIINLLQKYKFGIKKLEFAYHDYNSNCNIVLIESMKNGKNNCIVEKPLITKNYRGDII